MTVAVQVVRRPQYELYVERRTHSMTAAILLLEAPFDRIYTVLLIWDNLINPIRIKSNAMMTFLFNYLLFLR